MRLDIKEIADKADMIVNGYAFTKDGEYVRVLNLDYLKDVYKRQDQELEL